MELFQVVVVAVITAVAFKNKTYFNFYKLFKTLNYFIVKKNKYCKKM